MITGQSHDTGYYWRGLKAAGWLDAVLPPSQDYLSSWMKKTGVPVEKYRSSIELSFFTLGFIRIRLCHVIIKPIFIPKKTAIRIRRYCIIYFIRRHLFTNKLYTLRLVLTVHGLSNHIINITSHKIIGFRTDPNLF